MKICLALKLLFGMPLRQAIGHLQSLLRFVGLGWDVPDYSTFCRRQETLNVRLPCKGGDSKLEWYRTNPGNQKTGTSR